MPAGIALALQLLATYGPLVADVVAKVLEANSQGRDLTAEELAALAATSDAAYNAAQAALAEAAKAG